MLMLPLLAHNFELSIVNLSHHASKKYTISFGINILNNDFVLFQLFFWHDLQP